MQRDRDALRVAVDQRQRALSAVSTDPRARRCTQARRTRPRRISNATKSSPARLWTSRSARAVSVVLTNRRPAGLRPRGGVCSICAPTGRGILPAGGGAPGEYLAIAIRPSTLGADARLVARCRRLAGAVNGASLTLDRRPAAADASDRPLHGDAPHCSPGLHTLQAAPRVGLAGTQHLPQGRHQAGGPPPQVPNAPANSDL